MTRLAPAVEIPSRYLTRHIGIFGATGTGKTTTLGTLAERAPCPVLILDVKGDLESLGAVSYPAMRIADSDIMARALDLSPAQAGALQICLAWAEDTGQRLDTLADLRAALSAMDATSYGLVSPMSVSAVQRSMLRLERSTPWLFRHDIFDARRISGRHVVACGAIADQPGLYGAYVAQLLDSLYRGLGEIGDAGAGLLVMIDESHLLFDGATPAIVKRLEQVTRLIRSRGVGLVYVTQAPSDLPEAIAGQLATRVQHGLRGATKSAQAAIRAAAETMPGNVSLAEILALGVGEAFVSVPDSLGRATPGKRVKIERGAVTLHPVEKPPLPSLEPRKPRLSISTAEARSSVVPRKPIPWLAYGAAFWVVVLALELLFKI